jgi:hypothetical protein
VKRLLVIVATALTVLTIGFAVGAAGATHTTTPGKTRVVTHTRTVTQTPSACLAAIADARDIAASGVKETRAFQQTLGLFKPFGNAMLTMDSGLMQSVTNRLGGITDKVLAVGAQLKANPFNRDAARCEAS